MKKDSILAKISNFPHAPGVYFFFDANKNLIYVGKATSLRDRVKSYYIGKRSFRPIEMMMEKVADIKYQQTDSVLEAVILEANSIHDLQPRYNVMGKDDKSWNYIVITRDNYPQLQTLRQHDFVQLSKKQSGQKYLHVFGPFPGLNSRATLGILRRMFQVSRCTGEEKRACLYYQMGQCLGACVGEISPAGYKQKVIGPLVQFLKGNKKRLLKTLEKRMHKASQVHDFEEAARLRNQVFQLKKIHDVALLNKSFFENRGVGASGSMHRIEGYDISNLGATGKVGSMVVFEHGEPLTSGYRKFKIKTVEGQSDVDCLEEVLVRRLNHPEWKFPDVFLIDGGKPQVNRAKRVLQTFGIDTPIVGIAKGPARKKNEFTFSSPSKAFVHWVNEHQQVLVRVRDEAHRFAIKYQRSLRDLKKK
ncbi:UvrB/UvrC motif-containing protein [Candidatus Nomurabacteria bacterium]|nr:UvrB/UvrC motif-containing protein [Candidatus Nomurabacteria bacterium]